MLSIKENVQQEGLSQQEGEITISSTEAEELKRLGALFAAALTEEEETSATAWEQLLVYLESVLSRSQVNHLAEHPQTQHYVHRTVKHALKHSERLQHVGVISRLSKLFPGTVETLKKKDLRFSYSYSDIEPHQKVKHKRSATADSGEASSLYSYSPDKLAATFRGPSVQVDELLPAANKVSTEFRGIEKHLVHTHSIAPQTRHNIRAGHQLLTLPGYRTSHTRTRSTPESIIQFQGDSSEGKPLLVPLLNSEVQNEHFSRSNTNTLVPRKQVRSPRKGIEEGSLASLVSKLRNAYDVIEAFATGQLKTESESIYLNYTNSDRWNPYDLTIVPKTKVQPEHFVVSKFGILRVYSDETSDFQSFADWLREASLFKMLRKIPFLRHYPVKHAFKQWYGNVRYAQYVRVHIQVSRVSIRFLPDFTCALLKIQSLSEELLTVPFHYLTPLSCYSQDSLEHALQGSQSKAQRFLLKYFKYCRRIVTEVIKSTRNKVLELETEKRHKPFVSDLPLSIQKEKHLKLEQNLKAAQHQESKLANFVALVEHILFACFLKLSRQGAQSWVETVLSDDPGQFSVDTPGHSSLISTPVSRNIESSSKNEADSPSGRSSPSSTAFLSASFDFNESGTLCIQPSPSDLETLVIGPLQKIFSILSVVSPLTKSAAAQRPESSDKVHPGQKLTQESSPRAAPPSMVPARQPKSLLTVLKGIASSQGMADVVLQSERARSELSQVTGLFGNSDEKGDSLGRERSPLETMKFIEQIETDEVFSSCMASIKTAVELVGTELDDMCTQCSWLNNVWHFITHWEGKQKAVDMSADEYEMVLSQLYKWIQQFAQLPSRLLTSYSLLCVSTSTIVDRVHPQLTAIFEQVTSTGIHQAMTLCEKVLENIKQRVDTLSSKRYDLEGFAEYAHQLRECQSFDKSEADNIAYVLRVHSALLRHGVEVPEEDKALGKKLQLAWQMFEEKLKEAEVFVTAQTPVKAQGLQESIEACEDDMSELVSQVNEGKFIEPTGIPNELLEELMLIQEEVLAVRARLLDLSKWKEAITGKPHDLSGVSSLLDQQFVRQELWKYRRVFDTYEKEWIKTPFKKLDTSLISRKVTDWLEACIKLEKTLPPDDPVLTAWIERLQEYKDRIPLLQQLASKALRTSHWYTIFASLGEDYNPDHPYTLVEFNLYKIYDHSDIIFEICHDAMQQEKLRAKVVQLQSSLEQKVISISQFPIEHYPFTVPNYSLEKSVPSPRQTLTSQRKASLTSIAPVAPKLSAVKSNEPNTHSKATFSVGFQGLTKDTATLDCLFFVDQENQLCMWLENDMIQTKVLLSSPHLGNLKTRGEQLLKTLTELQEIVMLLSQCQEKWSELLSLFSHMDQTQRDSIGLKELQQATAKYQEIVLSVRDDPRLLSLLGKRRGQKGFRELQGEQLRQCIQEVDSVLEVVVHKVKGHLKDSCAQFPRLCYLSDKEILRIISNSENPISIMPLISRVFPAVKSMQLTEIVSNQSSPSFRKLATDIEEGLQLVAIEGWHGEQLPLTVPLPLGKRPAPLWLNALEGALSYSLASTLTDCLTSVPEPLMGTNGSIQSDSAITRWVSSNPSQCVQLSIELNWTSVIHAALSGEEPLTELNQTRTKLSSALDVITELVRSLGKGSMKTAPKRSFLPVLHSLVLILEHKRGIVKTLLDTKAVNPGCFSWRNCILYSTEVDSLYHELESNTGVGVLNDRSSTSSLSSTARSRLSPIPGKASLGHKLQGSSHSLVASSKSLLASRNSLLGNTKATHELHKSGSSSFVLTAELASSRRPVPTKCTVHCGEIITPYCFEYLSPDNRLVLTPSSEACMISVINSLARFTFCSLSGGPVSGKTETGKEIAKIVGRHWYQYCCSPVTTLSNLHRLLTGAMQTGSLLLLENFVSLQLQVLISLGEWFQLLTVLFTKAFKGKQSSIILTEQEEVNSETALTNVESTSTIGPLPVPSYDHHQSTRDSSNQSFISQLPGSNKTLTSQQPSKSSSLAVGSVLPEKVSSPLVHHSSQYTTHEHSFLGLVASSSMKTSTPVPSHTSVSPSQHSYAQQTLSGRTSRTTTRIDWYKMAEGELTDPSKPEWFGYGGGPKEELEFSGDLLRASPAFGCALISPVPVQSMPELPEQLKVALRSVGVSPPDLSCIIEWLLLSHGFKAAHKLSRSLSKFWQNLGHQVSSSDIPLLSSAINLSAMKLIINQAASILHNQSISGESISETEIIASSIRKFVSPQLTHPMETEQREESGEIVSTTFDLADWNKLEELLKLHFPQPGYESSVDRENELAELVDAIQAQLTEQHLQTLPSLLNKVKQLHVAVKNSKCVILSGPSGSGKTMTHNMLAAAYQHIKELRALGKSSKPSKLHRNENSEIGDEYPIIDITTINPAAYSFNELFGSYNDVAGEADHQHWRDGILTRILRHIQSLEEGKLAENQNAQEAPSTESVIHWIVLDGQIESSLIEALAPLVSGEGMFLPNGDKLNLPDCCQLLVETSTLSEMTPSLIAHSALLYFSGGVLSFDAVVDTWLDRAPTQHNLSAMSTETLATMIKQLLPDTLEYLHELNTKCLGTPYSLWAKSQTYGIAETQCFLNFLSAVLERNAPKVESSVTHTGMASRSSRMSSRMIDSRASSALLSAYSSSSMQVERSNISMSTSRMSVNMDGEPLDPMADNLPDDLSECNLEAEFGLSIQIQMASMLSFAYIWSLGAFCPFSELSSFSDFARDMIMQLPYAIPLPEEGSVFDYYLNLRQYQFLPWAERRGGSSGDVSSTGYVSLPELDRYTHITDLYLSYGFNVMIVGQRGTGKSSLVENLLQSRLPITRLQITSALTACQFQDKILARISAIEKRAGQRFSHRGSSNKCIFFLDDVHLASKSATGFSNDDNKNTSLSKTSAVLELTRFASTHHQLYDYSRNYQHTLNEVRFISSCTPEEYWRLPIEFSRTFNPVPFLPPSDECLRQIFSRSVLLWLQEFPEDSIGDPEAFAEALGAASVTVIRSLTDKILPSPSNPHLTFTLHDFMHVYEGLLLLSPDTKTQSQPQFSLLNRRGFLSSTQSGRTSRKKSSNKPKKNTLPSLGGSTSRVQVKSRRRGLLVSGGDHNESASTMRMVIRLWCHESTRVYIDRVVESRDRIWFTKLLEVCIKYCFCGDDLRGLAVVQQRQLGGTASYGGRRMRGGSRGGMLSQSLSSEGPSLEELSKTGIKVDILQKLLPPGEDGLRKLLSLDQVTMKGEDLTGLIFAQFPKASVSNLSDEVSSTSIKSTDSDKEHSNYAELGDGQVMDSLKKHIDVLKAHQYSDSARLILFRGAIEHASRICRVMSLVGSHALLIGAKGSGRRSLVRLMSQIFKAKLFEVSDGVDGKSPAESLQTTLRNVCVSAAVDSQQTVLLATNADALGAQDWEKLCLIMENGLCPGLFTTSELLVMSSKLQQGRVKKTTEGARQMFAKAVCKHLHVFIVWNVDNKTGSLFSTGLENRQHNSTPATSLSQPCNDLPPNGGSQDFSYEESLRTIFSSLCQACSYIDHFSSWTKQEYTDIALRWWQQGFGNAESTGVKWQDWIDTSSQLEAVGMLATHIHLTTTELLARIYGGSVSKLLSPVVFTECLRIAQELAVRFKAEEKVEADCLQLALQRLTDIDHTVYELEQELGVLKPQLALAEQEVQHRMSLITTAKEKYMAANQRCKMAENTIKNETKNVEHFSKMVEEKFTEVSPVYHSALHALSSVEKNEVFELMGYREPPDILKPVFDALCMLFDREQTWEDCKLLLLSPNFFENLRFFDKDNIPKRKLQRLEKMIVKHSKFEMLGYGSQAVLSLCSWLNALVDYHHAKMSVQPFRESLVEAERTLMEANKTFIDMRKDMMETKTELEKTVKLHKESVQKQRAVNAKVEDVYSKLDHASHLLTTMAKQRHKWEEKVKLTKNRIDSLPGHAMLCSAAVCYLTRVPPDKHKDLLSAWLGYCNGSIGLGNLAEDRGGLQATQGYQAHSGQQQVVRIQKDFSIEAHLSEPAEQSRWKQESVFPDQTILYTCLSARLYSERGTSSWPLIFDPHGHFKQYLQVFEHQPDTTGTECSLHSDERGNDTDVSSLPSQNVKSKSILQLDMSDQLMTQKLSRGMASGYTVLLSIKDVTGTQRETDDQEKFILLSRILKKDHKSRDSVVVHPNFKLFVILKQSLGDAIQESGPVESLLKLCSRDLSSLFVVDLGLSLTGLQNHLQKLILKHKKPEYSIRYKSLLTDLTLHQQQLKDNEETIIRSVVDTSTSLLELSDLIPTVQQSESSDLSTQEIIYETKKNLRAFDQQSLAYKALSEYSSLLYTCVHRLEKCFTYFKFPLEWFEQLFGEVLTSSSGRDVRVPDNLMAINAHVLHLKHQLLCTVSGALKVHLFERHQILLLLLVGLETLKYQGKLKTEEIDILGRVLLTTEGHVELVSPDSDTSSRHDLPKPSWISDESWCAVLQLQKSLPGFRRLSTEVVNHSHEWMEYFQMAPSLLLPVPGYGESCSMGQKLLLWRVFKPEIFSAVVKDFILLTFGADFTTSHACTIEAILPYTTPTLPALCYYSNTPSFTDSLKKAASVEGKEVYSVALIDENHLVDFESLLPDLMQDGFWLVVENIQMHSAPSDVLKSIEKVVHEVSETIEVHPEFRVWIPLSLSFYTTANLDKGFAFEAQKDKISGPDSLLRDLRAVVNYTSIKEGIARIHDLSSCPKWEMYESLLAKLSNFIPQTLSPADLIDLDPKQDTSQTIRSLIFEELSTVNAVVMTFHSSLENLGGFLRGQLPFTVTYGHTLSSLSNNKIPEDWLRSLSSDNGFPQALMPALKLLKQRFSFYVNSLKSGVVPSEFNPLTVPKPSDLISRVVCLFAVNHQLHPRNVSLQAQVAMNAEDVKSLEPCLVLKDLFLHGATVDKQGQLLPEPHNSSSQSQPCLVIVYFDKRDKAKSGQFKYNCPVILNSDHHSAFTIPLINCHHSVNSHSVYLSCDSCDCS